MNTHLVLERYKVMRLLGEGSVGSIYLVEDVLHNHTQLALKVLANENALDENTSLRFDQEVQVAHDIKHPNLIKVHDAYFIKEADFLGKTFKNKSAFTMEFVDGPDLKTRLGQGALHETQIDIMFLQLLSALEALHKKGISHRDIKLENILMRSDDDIVLTDLGIIKLESGSIKTQPGTWIGTVQYFPPEYLLKNIYDPQGDIYATGILLLEIITGKIRHSSFAGEKLAQHLIDTDFQISDQILETLSPKYRHIILKATAVDREKRYESTDEMSQDLLKDNVYYATSNSSNIITGNSNSLISKFKLFYNSSGIIKLICNMTLIMFFFVLIFFLLRFFSIAP